MDNEDFRNLELPTDDISRLLERGPKICHVKGCPLDLENAVARRPISDSDTKSDAQLREKLRAFRTEAAGGASAFTVFNDKTLSELVKIRPTIPFELRTVYGFQGGTGERLRKYGEAILAIISEHEEGEDVDIGEHDELLLACNNCSRGGPPNPLPSEQQAALAGSPRYAVVDLTGEDIIKCRIEYTMTDIKRMRQPL